MAKLKSSKIRPTEASHESGPLDLSESQAKVLGYIKDRFFSAGSMPTLREICRHMKWSAVGSAQDVVAALVEKGFLKKDSNRARGLSLKDAIDFRPVPLLGSAPAGVPIESTESHERDVLVPGFIRGPVFAVRVIGESMINAGINDGDLVIVKQTERAEDGEIVVAMLEGEVTIKRLKSKKNEFWLMPENPRFQAKRVNDASFRVLGRVVGLHRYWEGTF